MSESYDLPRADWVTVGTVGLPGQRVFMLQARMGPQLVTLKLEKAQVSVLAEYLAQLLEQAGDPVAPDAERDLEEPAEPEWVVGTLGLAYDADDDLVVLVAEEAVAEEEEGGAVARFGLTRSQAGAVAIRGTRLVEAGRPSCPLCGYPLDPDGHACPKKNGSRPPAT